MPTTIDEGTCGAGVAAQNTTATASQDNGANVFVILARTGSSPFPGNAGGFVAQGNIGSSSSIGQAGWTVSGPFATPTICAPTGAAGQHDGRYVVALYDRLPYTTGQVLPVWDGTFDVVVAGACIPPDAPSLTGTPHLINNIPTITLSGM